LTSCARRFFCYIYEQISLRPVVQLCCALSGINVLTQLLGTSASLTGCLDVAIEILKASLSIHADRNRWKLVVSGVNATPFSTFACATVATTAAAASTSTTPSPRTESGRANSTLIGRVLCTRCPVSGNYLVLFF